jgi:hypothetical protein
MGVQCDARAMKKCLDISSIYRLEYLSDARLDGSEGVFVNIGKHASQAGDGPHNNVNSRLLSPHDTLLSTSASFCNASVPKALGLPA